MSLNFFAMIFSIIAFFIIVYFKKNNAPLKNASYLKFSSLAKKEKLTTIPLNAKRIVNIQTSSKNLSVFDKKALSSI